MKEYNISRLLEKEDEKIKKSRWNKFKHVLFTPYYFFMESFCRRKIWVNYIMRDMITNDEIIDFLDKQDFTIRNNVFIKKGLCNDPEKSEKDNIYNFSDMEKVKDFVTKDYIQYFIKLLTKNFQFDVENYVNLHVKTEVAVVHEKQDDKYFREPIYIVIFQYWREQNYLEEKHHFLIWLITFLICISFITFIIIF